MIKIYEILRMNIGEDVKDLAIKGLASRPGDYVLAVDFDGTLCRDDFPWIKLAYDGMVEKVLRVQGLGVKVVLWTCREGDLLRAALAWCSEHGIVFNAVNDNTSERKVLYNNNPRKVGYDELWDDRAVEI